MKYHRIKFQRDHQYAGRTFKKGEEQKRKKEEAEKRKLEDAQEEIVRLKKELEFLKKAQRVVEKVCPKSSGQMDLDNWIGKT